MLKYFLSHSNMLTFMNTHIYRTHVHKFMDTLKHMYSKLHVYIYDSDYSFICQI